jgi:hypothetical protein
MRRVDRLSQEECFARAEGVLVDPPTVGALGRMLDTRMTHRSGERRY